MLDPEAIERVRSASFNPNRRGYDRDEVDLFLSQLADWLEGLEFETTESETVQRELDRIAEQTADVLKSAGEAAAALREDAQQRAAAMIEEARVEANGLRVDADSYTERVMSDADEYASSTRGQADAYAKEKRAEAEAIEGSAKSEAERMTRERLEGAQAEAERMVNEGRERREELDREVGDLLERRDALLDELERIAGTLTGTASEHRGRRAEVSAPEAGDAVAPSGDGNEVAPSGDGDEVVARVYVPPAGEQAAPSEDDFAGPSDETRTLEVIDDSTDEVPTARRTPVKDPSRTEPA